MFNPRFLGTFLLLSIVMGTSFAYANTFEPSSTTQHINPNASEIANSVFSEAVIKRAEMLGIHLDQNVKVAKNLDVLQDILGRINAPSNGSTIVSAIHANATVDDYGKGDEKSGEIKLLIDNRPVWALHITGIDTPHYGPVGSISTTKETEYVVLYDSLTGEFLSATSVS